MMFLCQFIAPLINWHVTHQSQDGKWRIATNSLPWQHIYSIWPKFGGEPQNLRLALGTDGVNPFGLRNHSWLVVLVNYNLPPHMAIKKSHIMLSRLSIFFEFPYWEDLKINHLLDTIDISKNVETMVWDHLMGVQDSLAIRMDLQFCGKIHSAWLVELKNGHVILLKAPWTLMR
jgi:hypothetical protein